VDHVALQDGLQRVPFRFQQGLPGGGQDVGGVLGYPVTGQDPLDSAADRRLPPQRLGYLPMRLIRGGRPDLIEQIRDRGGQAGRDRGQEVRPPARRMQGQDQADIRLPRQRLVPVARLGQPGPEHRFVALRRIAGQRPQRPVQLPQR
jgi:hypothetical protein